MYENEKYIGYIYKVTNSVNGKIYIGQTRQTIKRRWSQHITNSKLEQNHSILDTAIKKYGDDKFVVDCVEKVITKTKQELINILNIKEKEYITKYNSSCKYGNYNITEGGEKVSSVCLVPIDQYSLDGKYIKTHQSMMDAIYDLNINESCFANISACCRGKKVTAYGYIWRYKGEPFNKYRIKRKTTAVHFPIDIYDMYGNILYQYDDCQNAIKDGIVNRIQDIRKVCDGINSSYHKLVIRYKGDSFDKYPISFKTKSNLYNGYNIITNELCIKNMSTREIWEYLNINENIPIKYVINNVCNCVHNRLKSWKGYKFFYADDPNQPVKQKL